MFSELLEVGMVLSFGIAWPASIMKSLRTRTSRGKSLQFLLIVFFGYACGIGSKLVSDNLNYVVIFYIVNFVMVGFDTVLYFRNQKLDRLAENRAAARVQASPAKDQA